eukprot:824871-Pelagomonas_calceolata.AAC.1
MEQGRQLLPEIPKKPDLQHGQISVHLLNILLSIGACSSALYLRMSNSRSHAHAVPPKKALNSAHTCWHLCLLDSQPAHPVCLSSTLNWHNLHGSLLTMYIYKEDNIWNKISSTSVLYLANPSTPGVNALLQPDAQQDPIEPRQNETTFFTKTLRTILSRMKFVSLKNIQSDT